MGEIQGIQSLLRLVSVYKNSNNLKIFVLKFRISMAKSSGTRLRKERERQTGRKIKLKLTNTTNCMLLVVSLILKAKITLVIWYVFN